MAANINQKKAIQINRNLKLLVVRRLQVRRPGVRLGMVVAQKLLVVRPMLKQAQSQQVRVRRHRPARMLTNPRRARRMLEVLNKRKISRQNKLIRPEMKTKQMTMKDMQTKNRKTKNQTTKSQQTKNQTTKMQTTKNQTRRMQKTMKNQKTNYQPKQTTTMTTKKIEFNHIHITFVLVLILVYLCTTVNCLRRTFRKHFQAFYNFICTNVEKRLTCK